MVGSPELAARTGAEIWHADSQLDYHYGKPIKEGQNDTIFHKLLPLGDQVSVCPAHGAGSVCGGNLMAERVWTTIASRTPVGGAPRPTGANLLRERRALYHRGQPAGP